VGGGSGFRLTDIARQEWSLDTESTRTTTVTRFCPHCMSHYPYQEDHLCPAKSTPAAPLAPQDRLVGATIDGRYEVKERLGEGGMGLVYKARHVLLEKIVAVKVLRNTEDPEAIQRFRQEAKSASMINHSNVVAITDFGVLPDGHMYLVMEFLEGRTLTQAISGKPMGALRACQIAVQIARGLQAVHDKGIIHRDLKPDNIFLQDREGLRDQVKIVDFGVAKVEASARLTAHGMVMGTAEYIAPEQAAGLPVDARCDQYALGCILYEMLAGVQVFQAESAPMLMKMHVYDAPVPPRERRPEADIPESVNAIVVRLLAKRPEQRFPSMADVEQVLQAEIDQLVKAPLAGGSIPAMLVKRAQSSRKWLLGIAAAILVLAGAVVALQTYLRPPPVKPVEPQRPVMAGGKPVVTAPRPEPDKAPVKPAEPATEPRTGPAAKALPGRKPVPPRKVAPVETGGPLKVQFIPVKPADVTLTCTPNIKQRCQAGCIVTLPAGNGQCVASAAGFASKPFPYNTLQRMRKGQKGPVRQKFSLVDLR
jgi:tRNA A-37 threonylcarbamoyl transferase component Bud32